MSEPNTFPGFCDDTGKLTLDHPAQFKAYVARKFKGCEVVLTVEDKAIAKTRAQEKGFHAMITPWAKDRGDRIDDLKRSLLEAVFGTMEVRHPLTDEVFLVLRQPHTSKLSKKDYSDLIEQTLEIAASRGYILEAPNEYKERKRLERLKAEKAAKRGRAA